MAIKKNRLGKRGYHPLKYDEIQELARENKCKCGYMRNPLYNPKNNSIIGDCSLKKFGGLASKCEGHPPVKTDDCKYYRGWLMSRQTK